MIDNELKKKMASFIKENLTGGFMSEEDIIWIMDECDKGNKPTYDDFVKARKQPKVIESKDICCYNCRNLCKSFDEEPCKNCLITDERQPFLFRHPYFVDKHPHFEEKETVVHKDDSPLFGPNMMRQEEFKIPDSIQIMIDQNKKPNLTIPQLDGLKEDIKTYHDDTEKYLTGFSGWLTRIETKVNTIKSHQINLEEANHAIENKIDKLAEALESVNSKLDILDQRMHDFRQHQILKDTKCEDTEKDIPVRPEPLFKVGDIVKLTHDTKHRNFFVHKIKWSERSNRWNYLISLDSEDISGAFWRMEGFLIKSEDYIEPLFKVGDKVKLKHGKVVYDVYSITYFMHDKKKVYRYKIGHKATTPHYENENRLIKA